MSSKASSIDLKKASASVSHFFGRYHTILFFLFVSGGLITCLFIIMQIINISSQSTPNQNDIVNQTFDKDTIKRLQQLDNSNHQFVPPPGRINPFAE